jgi:hypothetical protein
MFLPARNRHALRRTTASLAAVAAATAGAAVLGGGTPAHAAVSESDYGLQGIGYGTRVTSGAGLESARSAFSLILCTRMLGLEENESVAAIDLPADDPMVEVDNVRSTNRTFRNAKKDIAAAMESTNAIARVELGDTTTPQLIIEGLTTTSRAWATRGDRLKTSNRVTTSDISLLNLPEDVPDELAGPLQDLQDAVDGGIGEVLAAIQDNGGTIVIPGLGEVSLGFDRQRVAKRYAVASSHVLRVLLYGEDGEKATADDARVSIGRSWARITRGLPAGVMRGGAWGADAELVDGVARIGRIGFQPLPCQGTDGKVLSAPQVGIDVAAQGQAVVEGARGRAWGVQRSSGVAKAWTEGSVSDLTFGPLEIRGITGRVNVEQDRRGRIVENSIAGSSIGELVVDGESQGRITPANARELEAIEVPGLADIDFFVRDRNARGGEVAAVVLEFAPDSPGATQLRLGLARASIKRR